MTVWYPVMLNMTGKKCLVFGGGNVAERRVNGLLEAGAQVQVVSLALTAALQALVLAGRISWQKKEAEPGDVTGADYVFVATSDAAVNRRLADAVKAAGVALNLADNGASGDVLLPAVVRRGQLTMTVSTSGASPALAARIAAELAEQYGPEYADYTEQLARIRRLVQSEVKDRRTRRRLLKAAARRSFMQELPSKFEEGQDQRNLALLLGWTNDRQVADDQEVIAFE